MVIFLVEDRVSKHGFLIVAELGELGHFAFVAWLDAAFVCFGRILRAQMVSQGESTFSDHFFSVTRLVVRVDLDIYFARWALRIANVLSLYTRGQTLPKRIILCLRVYVAQDLVRLSRW